MERKIQTKIKGYRTVDGAGVNLVRVLGNHTTEEFDPILMLDSFDSTDPKDYIAGFPMHPHRGIETISYLSRGKMVHRDNLGNGTYQRIKKDSFYWYKKVIKTNGEDLY